MAKKDIVKAENNAVTFSDQLINSKYSSLSEESKTALAEQAAREKIALEKKATEDMITNQNAERNIDNHIDAAQRLARERYTKGTDTIESRIETSSGEMRIKSNSGYCYVATATYQNINHPNVIILRDFRDRYLSQTVAGRLFIRAYYTFGEYLAVLPSTFPIVRTASKKIIDAIVSHIVKKYYNYTN